MRAGILASSAADSTISTNVGPLVGDAVHTPIKVERVGTCPAAKALAAQGLGDPLRVYVVGNIPGETLGDVGHSVGLNSSFVNVSAVAQALRALDQYNVERAAAAHGRAQPPVGRHRAFPVVDINAIAEGKPLYCGQCGSRDV